ncbi:MAG: hypothetical protein DRJ62_05050, partial [Thermoprotei archaeon]
LAYQAGAELVDMEFNQIALEPQYSRQFGQTQKSSALAMARALRSTMTFQETPSVHHFLGGVVIDEKASTTVPGLYACGEVAGGLHLKATDQFIGCLVFGKRAGEAAAREKCDLEMPLDAIKGEVERVVSILTRSPKDPLPPYSVRRKLMDTMWRDVGLSKSEESLNNALKVIEEVKDLLPRMYVRDKSRTFNKEWVEALEAYNMVIVAEMVVRASLMRKESRGVFRRVDYPREDDRYLGNIFVKKVGEQMVLEFRRTTEREVIEKVVA